MTRIYCHYGYMNNGMSLKATDTTAHYEHDESTCLFCSAGEPSIHNYEPGA